MVAESNTWFGLAENHKSLYMQIFWFVYFVRFLWSKCLDYIAQVPRIKTHIRIIIWNDSPRNFTLFHILVNHGFFSLLYFTSIWTNLLGVKPLNVTRMLIQFWIVCPICGCCGQPVNNSVDNTIKLPENSHILFNVWHSIHFASNTGKRDMLDFFSFFTNEEELALQAGTVNQHEIESA